METTRKYRRFRRAFKVAAVQRMQQGESPSALARELGIRRKLLYEWKRRIEQLGPEAVSEDGRPGRLAGSTAAAAPRRPQGADHPRRIAELERLVGKQQALIDFFERALRQVEAKTAGKAKSTKPFGKSANQRDRS